MGSLTMSLSQTRTSVSSSGHYAIQFCAPLPNTVLMLFLRILQVRGEQNNFLSRSRHFQAGGSLKRRIPSGHIMTSFKARFGWLINDSVRLLLHSTHLFYVHLLLNQPCRLFDHLPFCIFEQAHRFMKAAAWLWRRSTVSPQLAAQAAMAAELTVCFVLSGSIKRVS